MGNYWNEEIENNETTTNQTKKIDPQDLNSDDWSLISKVTNYQILDSSSCRIILLQKIDKTFKTIHDSFIFPDENKENGFNNHEIFESLMFGKESMDPEMDTKIHISKDFNQILLTKQFTITQKKKIKKYSLGVILQFGNEDEDKTQIILQKFFLTHFPIIEFELSKLKSCCFELLSYGIESDYDYISIESTNFINFIKNFFNSPRIPNLFCLQNSEQKSRFLFENLMKFKQEFRQSFKSETKFISFLSSIITGILSHHLSWVTPFLKKENKSDNEKYSSISRLISSIYGSNYYYHTDKSKCAKKFCRVILTGKNKEMMKYLSFILSYFLKSEQIFENSYFPHNETNHLSWLPGNEKMGTTNSPTLVTFSPKQPFSPISYQSKSFFSEGFIEQPTSKFKEFDEKEIDPDSPTDTETTEEDSGSVIIGSMAQSFKVGSNFGSLNLGEESYIDKSSFLPKGILSRIQSTRDISPNNKDMVIEKKASFNTSNTKKLKPVMKERNSNERKSPRSSGSSTGSGRKSPIFEFKKTPELQVSGISSRRSEEDFFAIIINKEQYEEEQKKMNLEMKDIPMIFSDLLFQKSYPTIIPSTLFLFTNICSTYCSSFVLMSIEKSNIDDSFNEDVKNDLKLMLTYPYDGKSPDVSTCLMIDVDDLTCNVLVCTKNTEVEEKIEPSNFVTVLIKEIIGLKEMGVTEIELEKYLNDKLEDLFLKSKLI
eukprot:gene5210-8822_t